MYSKLEVDMFLTVCFIGQDQRNSLLVLPSSQKVNVGFRKRDGAIQCNRSLHDIRERNISYRIAHALCSMEHFYAAVVQLGQTVPNMSRESMLIP